MQTNRKSVTGIDENNVQMGLPTNVSRLDQIPRLNKKKSLDLVYFLDQGNFCIIFNTHAS